MGTARREAPLAPFRGARVAAGAQARDDASVALLSLPMLLLACAAWRPDAPGRFDLVVPQGWEITHNRSIFGTDALTLVEPTARATITLQLVHADAASRVIPLDLLAETRSMAMGRTRGVENSRGPMSHIALDGHEAWAVTGRRRWQFADADYSAVYTRVGTRIAMITLQAPSGRLDDALRGWSVVLDTLRFPRDPVPPDAPEFEVD